MSKNLIFIDAEIGTKDHRIYDLGALRADETSFHSASLTDFLTFIQDADFLCGHNVIHHDLKYINEAIGQTIQAVPIDTLYLSPLLFPKRPYHKLLKDDKLQVDELNNPLNDCQKCCNLFYDEVNAFTRLSVEMQWILARLLSDFEEYAGFFQYLDYRIPQEEARGFDLRNVFRGRHYEAHQKTAERISQYFAGRICANAPMADLVEHHPRELAYALALIEAGDPHSLTPPWLLRNFPQVEYVLWTLCNVPCKEGCGYCNQRLDPHQNLQKYFGFKEFRTYDGEPLQEKAVRAAIADRSLLAIFPTGGGKSLTFQLPALMAGDTAHALTVVISPLQSLMKDQVDNLREKGIESAVTINGLLDPIERANAIQRVADGSCTLLYIAPEMLRSKTIVRLLTTRAIARFVIDEAHCFSAWGQDFRVDYLYIADFIRQLQQAKNNGQNIQVSCFTATAKQKVISDIKEYFRQKLNLHLEVIASDAARENLRYAVIHVADIEQKYLTLRQLLMAKEAPAIVYVSRTKRAEEIATKLSHDGFSAMPYHGKMEAQHKIDIQNDFISNKIQIIVATSAFGMGVDKKDVGLVVHYDISDSLENYVQEAGRAGRDPQMQADCYVLFNDNDLDQHFILLNQTKLSISEIRQVWKSIKELSRRRSKISCSALEIARQAGWEGMVRDVETRVRSAIAALEEANLVRRGNNMPRVFASSIRVRTMDEAVSKLQQSPLFSEQERQDATRIISALISARSVEKAPDGSAESRVDYLADTLGITKASVINAIQRMRQEKILSDAQDMSAHLLKEDSQRGASMILEKMARLEQFLLPLIGNEGFTLTLKEINEAALSQDIRATNPKNIRTILYFLTIRKWIRKRENPVSGHIQVLPLLPQEVMLQKFEQRIELCRFIVRELYANAAKSASASSGEVSVAFSLLGLMDAFNRRSEIGFDSKKVDVSDVEEALLYLSKINAMRLDGGFLVLYNAMEINLIAERNKNYKIDDYKLLNEFYKQKIQQIHIVGEYAHLMVRDQQAALRFVHDYFQMDYKLFISRYFKGERKAQIDKNISPEKYEELFGTLSPRQREIIDDHQSKYIVVSAGPGSGKTRVLVHKLAALLLMEDVKAEQLLMLTFSRAAATEFKQRLLKLIGNAALFVQIKTFHSYAFDIIGKNGSLEASADVVKNAVEMIRSGEVDPQRISKTVLVVDEAQDMDGDEFNLLKELMLQNEDMRVIAVGDDDQNIYEWRGSNPHYFNSLIEDFGAVKYDLLDNYRSCQSIVSLANGFVTRIENRMKTKPIVAVSDLQGDVTIIEHRDGNLEQPIVDDIVNNRPSGTCGVLTLTNDEALRVTGLLLQNKVKAKLIQSADGFRFYDLDEVRYFLWLIDSTLQSPVIDESDWEQSKQTLAENFQNSRNLEIVQNFIQQFEQVNPQKYRTDLQDFVMESQLEDFCNAQKDAVVVSTIHKAKGREFDNVYMLLHHATADSDSDCRKLYVGMTRAKQLLHLHCDNMLFHTSETAGLKLVTDNLVYPSPKVVSLNLTHRDVFLSYYNQQQSLIANLRSGTPLQIVEGGLSVMVGSQNRMLVRYSHAFETRLEELERSGYKPLKAAVHYVVWWRGENEPTEIRIVLPVLQFSRALS